MVKCVGLLAVGLVLGGGTAAGQKAAPQMSVTVVVVDAHVDPSKPVGAVGVSLTYLDGSRPIKEANDSTNPRGEATLHVLPDTAQRDDLRITISGAEDLVIYRPADGQISKLAPGATIKIELLPRGLAKLAEPAQIEAVQRRLSLLQNQNTRQRGQIKALETRLETAQLQADSQKQDVNAGLEEWAKANGLALPDVQKKVQEWAQSIEADPAASAERKALAEFALKNYGAAGDDFGAARRALKSKRLEQDRMDLQEELDTAEQQANSYQLAARFHDATVALQETRDDIAAEQKESPQDIGLQLIWLQAVSATAKARRNEAEVADPSLSMGLLKQSADDFQTLKGQYVELGDKRGAAMAQKYEADVLVAEADYTSYTEAELLLDKAIPLYKGALKDIAQDKFPEDWASTQIATGIALLGKGERETENSVPFLTEAVERYNEALKVFSRAEHPQEWAAINKNIGEALSIEGELTQGEQSAKALNGSVQALRSALDVYTQKANPQDWASTQVRLGYALSALARQSQKDLARKLLGEAIQAYQSALNVYAKDTLPQPWADAEEHLGWGQEQLVSFTDGDSRITLLNQAIESHEHYLEVHTKDNDPMHWTSVEGEVGTLHREIATLVGPEQAKVEFDQALKIYREELQLQVKLDDPEELFGISADERDIGNTLLERAQLLGRDDAIHDSSEAAQLFRSSMTHLVDYSKGKKWPNWLIGSWLQTAQSLNTVEIALGHDRLSSDFFETPLKDAEDPKAALGLFTNMYHEQLFRFERAFELNQQRLALDPSSNQRLNYMEASLSAEHFDLCLAQEGPLKDAKLDASNAVVRDMLGMSCSWAAGDMARALASERELAGETAGISKDAWNFTGTLHFLANSPKFEHGRPAWIALLNAVQNGDAAGMTKALHDLEPLLQ